MRDKKSGDEGNKASAPLWMVSYGDMVTNMLVFFVLLFSFSTIDAQKWKAIVIAFTGDRGYTNTDMDNLPSPDPNIGIEDIDPDDFIPDISDDDGKIGTGEPQNDEIDEFDELFQKIKEYVDESALKGRLDLTKNDTEILIRFRDSVIFDSGKADIKAEAEQILNHIAEVLLIYEKEIDMIRIEGHTDNVPIHREKYPSNWELSTARAVSVLRFFIEDNGLNPMKLSAVGYSEYHPAADNSTEEGRAVNRRVDVVIARYIDATQNIKD